MVRVLSSSRYSQFKYQAVTVLRDTGSQAPRELEDSLNICGRRIEVRAVLRRQHKAFKLACKLYFCLHSRYSLPASSTYSPVIREVANTDNRNSGLVQVSPASKDDTVLQLHVLFLLEDIISEESLPAYQL